MKSVADLREPYEPTMNDRIRDWFRLQLEKAEAFFREGRTEEE
jgi:hypothetical protein